MLLFDIRRCAFYFIFGLMAGVLLAAAPTAAKFYRFIDENGIVRFTDDLSQVPADQREAAQEYREEAPDQPPAAAPIRETSGTAVPEIKLSDDADLDATAKRLNALRRDLDTEYKALITEQSAMKSEKKVTQNKFKAKEHADRQAAFAEKVKRYDAKRKMYEEEVRVYNARIEAEARKSTEKPEP